MTVGPAAAHGPRLWWHVWRAEGTRALLDRAHDRWREARRRRAFRPADRSPEGFRAPVLIVTVAPPAPRLGGVQAQLLWRLEAAAALHPLALLYPIVPAATGGAYRLELSAGRRRVALEWRPPGGAAPAPGNAGSAPAAGGATVGPRLAAGNAVATSAADTARAEAAKGGAGAEAPPDDAGFKAAVGWALAQSGAAALQVEGLAGMPLAPLLDLAQNGPPLILALHDFAAFCPRPHLWEQPPPPAPHRFCDYSRDAGRCSRCLVQTWPGLPAGYQESRRETAARLLAAAAAVVYPSAFLAAAHRRLFPGLAAATGAAGQATRIIAPAPPPGGGPLALRGDGRRTSPGSRPAPPGGTRRIPPASLPLASAGARGAVRWPPRHVAWVGAVQEHKGALVFEAAVRQLAAAGRRPRLTAFGGGDRAILARWRRLPGLRVRGYYRAGSLAALLRRQRVDMALLLSVVPESYGLALDECAAAGVPVVAYRLGAIGERLAPGAGLLLDPPAPDADADTAGRDLARLLGRLLDGEARLDAGRQSGDGAPLDGVAQLGDQALLDGRAQLDGETDTPSTPTSIATAADSAAAWLELYRGLGLRTDFR